MHGLIHRHRGNRKRTFDGRSSQFYDFLAKRLLRRVYRRFAEDIAAAAPVGGTVLDVGTGPGVLLAELARLRPDLTVAGVDLSADMAAAASRNLAEFGDRASAHQGDVTRLPLPDHSCDVIVSSLSMHHWDDPAAAVRELVRVLRPGGRVYTFDFEFAPFDELVAGAAGTPLTSAGPPRRTPIRLGVPFLPTVVRCVMEAKPTVADRPA